MTTFYAILVGVMLGAWLGAWVLKTAAMVLRRDVRPPPGRRPR